jgi:hypothetical protein
VDREQKDMERKIAIVDFHSTLLAMQQWKAASREMAYGGVALIVSFSESGAAELFISTLLLDHRSGFPQTAG